MPKAIYITSVPELINIWDEKENVGIDPNTITVGNQKEFAWKCQKGHIFHSSPRSLRHGCGCSVCAGKEILIGYNDLLSQNPILCEDWDYERNKKGPSEYTAHSGKSVHWMCKNCGYRWKAPINNRSKGSGCSRCSLKSHTSFPEQAILYYLNKYFKSIETQVRFSGKYTLDILINDINTAVEYDGFRYHNSKKAIKRDAYKDKYCYENGIRLIRIKEMEKENDITVTDNCIYYFRDKLDKQLDEVIFLLLHHCLAVKDVKKTLIRVRRDRNDIYKNYLSVRQGNSLEKKFPDIADEWDYEANYPITPSMVSYSNNESFFWRCKKYNHSFESTVDKRTLRNYNCPFCSGRRLLVGFNDFETWCKNNEREDLIHEWYDTRKITDFLMGNKKECIKWKCKRCGHVWDAPILSRARGYNNCSKCNDRIKYQYIVKCDANNTIIDTYPSTSTAGKKNHLLSSKIADAIIDNKMYGGYYWKLKKP